MTRERFLLSRRPKTEPLTLRHLCTCPFRGGPSVELVPRRRSRERPPPFFEPERLPSPDAPEGDKSHLAALPLRGFLTCFHHVDSRWSRALGSGAQLAQRGGSSRSGRGPPTSAAQHNPRALPRVLIPDPLSKNWQRMPPRRTRWRGSWPEDPSLTVLPRKPSNPGTAVAKRCPREAWENASGPIRLAKASAFMNNPAKGGSRLPPGAFHQPSLGRLPQARRPSPIGARTGRRLFDRFGIGCC